MQLRSRPQPPPIATVSKQRGSCDVAHARSACTAPCTPACTPFRTTRRRERYESGA
jgi:hypothetical protein